MQYYVTAQVLSTGLIGQLTSDLCSCRRQISIRMGIGYRTVNAIGHFSHGLESAFLVNYVLGMVCFVNFNVAEGLST